MAFSSSKLSRDVGSTTVTEVHSFDSDGVTTGTISTGLGTIFGVFLNNEVTEADGIATKSGQTVTLAGLTSGDTGTIVVIGH